MAPWITITLIAIAALAVSVLLFVLVQQVVIGLIFWLAGRENAKEAEKYNSRKGRKR